MALPKPTSKSDWVSDGAAAKQVEPSAAKKLLGWVALERPAFEYANYIQYIEDQWTKYFESVTDELVAGDVGFDAVVGVGGTHADLNAVDADGSVLPGSRVYVRDIQNLSVKQVISKDDLEVTFHPNAIITQLTTLATGIEITGERVRLIRPRFVNFDNNVGDIPLLLSAATRNCLIDTPFFVGNLNPDPLENQGVNNAIISPIEEV